MVAHVDPLTDQWMAGFGKVDADLVRAPGGEPASDELRSIESFQRLDVGDRELPFATDARRASQTVAAVLQQVALEPLRLWMPVDDRQVATLDGSLAELAGEYFFCRERTREHQEAARVFVETL